MLIRFSYNKSDDIGVFIKLTNSYCIVPHDISEKNLQFIKNELKSFCPIFKASILKSKCIGRLIIGNKKGIVLPYETTYDELQIFRNALPDNIIVKRCNENFSALGNCIAINDYSAIIHPEISNATEELISDILGVETFKLSLGAEKLAGSYCIFNNFGGLIHPLISIEDQDEISSLLQIPLLIGTVNSGETCLGSGIITNDYLTICGFRTTQSELLVMENAFCKKKFSKKN
jgi:translation initiation factor 6